MSKCLPSGPHVAVQSGLALSLSLLSTLPTFDRISWSPGWPGTLLCYVTSLGSTLVWITEDTSFCTPPLPLFRHRKQDQTGLGLVAIFLPLLCDAPIPGMPHPAKGSCVPRPQTKFCLVQGSFPSPCRPFSFPVTCHRVLTLRTTKENLKQKVTVKGPGGRLQWLPLPLTSDNPGQFTKPTYVVLCDFRWELRK